jgi:hypothetical protein
VSKWRKELKNTGTPELKNTRTAQRAGVIKKWGLEKEEERGYNMGERMR